MNLNSFVAIFGVQIFRIKHGRIKLVQIFKNVVFYKFSGIFVILSHGKNLCSVHEIVTVLAGLNKAYLYELNIVFF